MKFKCSDCGKPCRKLRYITKKGAQIGFCYVCYRKQEGLHFFESFPRVDLQPMVQEGMSLYITINQSEFFKWRVKRLNMKKAEYFRQLINLDMKNFKGDEWKTGK